MPEQLTIASVTARAVDAPLEPPLRNSLNVIGRAPLVIAERFKTLEALFPGRIDLGLGRAPGTDQTTAYALRRRLDPDQAGAGGVERTQRREQVARGRVPGPAQVERELGQRARGEERREEREPTERDE